MNSPLISLIEAAKIFPLRSNGRPITAKTLRRRIRVGVAGVRLRAVRDGREWFTSETWITEFQEELTRRAVPERARSENERSRDSQLARATLATKFGMKV